MKYEEDELKFVNEYNYSLCFISADYIHTYIYTYTLSKNFKFSVLYFDLVLHPICSLFWVFLYESLIVLHLVLHSETEKKKVKLYKIIFKSAYVLSLLRSWQLQKATNIRFQYKITYNWTRIIIRHKINLSQNTGNRNTSS